MSPTSRPQLSGLRPSELVALAREHGEPAYRGRQLARALFQRRVADLDEATDLPRAWRERLREEFELPSLQVVEQSEADDGTMKYLFQLADGARIESVAMPRGGDDWTYCLSSQVGCRMACVFCATGRMGIVRQLDAGEIVAQVLELRRRHPSPAHPNLVFMGMGEPLDNLDALETALDILTDADGVGLGARRITVSTSGLVEGIRRLTARGRPVGLAISLTSADPAERRRLMPVAGLVPLEELLAAAAEHGRRTRRKVTLECAIIAGDNDTEEHARELLRLARTGPFKVNLIPLNPVDGYTGRRPDPSRIARMADILWQGKVVCTVRDSQGRDVDAACGQLLHRQERKRDGAPRGRAV